MLPLIRDRGFYAPCRCGGDFETTRHGVRQRMEPPLLVLRTLISLGLFSFVTNQICDEGSYTIISNPRRSVQATYDSAVDIPLCDSGIEEGTWFRFSSSTGDTIVEREANNPVPVLHCGTDAPIYIRGLGSHPVTDYATTNATICSNNGGSTCNWMDTIQIHRCPIQGNPNHYYLYKLKSPPGCSLSYCVGKKAVCNPGDYWNGFSCVNNVPVMTGFPKFSGSQTVMNEIYFNCEVQYERQPNDSYARFRVTFLFDGQPLEYIDADASYPPKPLEPTILRPDYSLSAQLFEYQLRGRLGREISCQAESYWDTDNGNNSSMTSEAKYYAAFESTAERYSISLINGTTHNVTFKSTLPFTCNHCLDEVDVTTCCRYKFYMVNYTVSSVQCYLLWTGGDTATVTAYFVPGATQAANSFALVFEKYTDDLITGPSLWHDYVIPAVEITILPQSPPYKQCYSTTDPHLLTFDGVNFDNILLGDFYLAKAINTNQLMEIQVCQETCNGPNACNCGVIVREGNSVYKISICEAGPWSPTVQRNPQVVRLLSQDPADASVVYVDGTGLLFSIRMPSGLRVEVDVRVPWFSMYVYMPPEYYGKTDSASMCGNSNGNPNDDSTTNMEQFRIPDDLSYFRQQPPCSSIFNVAAAKCGCNETYPKCSNKDPTLEDISAADNPYPGNWTSGVVCSQTPVAVMSSSLCDNSNADNDFILDDDILFPPFPYDPNFGVDDSFVWPTPKGNTETQVEQYCADMLQSSPVYANCSANVDLTTIIDMCFSYIQQSCLNNIAASIRNSSDSTHDLLTSVSAKLCPNQCSGHGTCSDATCTCTTGYIGADCSIDQILPPSLTGIIRGVCDVRKRPCDVIGVYGNGVAFSSALKCRFTDQNTGARVETNGTFITAVEYSCQVPETTTHRRRKSVSTRTTALSEKTVSITVDGDHYSNELDFVLFDSVCMECTSTDTCQQTNNSCLISDECFPDKAINPNDPCLNCVPSVSRNSWTNVTVVEDWSPCTRDCDTGVTTRNTSCGTTVTNEQVEFCKERDCPDNAGEKSQGVEITLSSEDLKLILIDPLGSLVPFSDALNQYCAKNAAACCSSIGIETEASAVNYTTPNLLGYASGYPVINTTDASLKIIVKIDIEKLEAECSGTPAQGSNTAYADPKLIFDAVTSEKSEIEQALSITITSVWSSTSLPSSAPRTDASVYHNLNGI